MREITQFPRSTEDENRCIKADASQRCRVSQVPLFYRPGGVADSLSMPLYRPFPTQPSSPFSPSFPSSLSLSLAPRPVCLFPRRWLPIYFSLYPLRTWSPSRLEGSSPFSSPLSLSLYPTIYLFLSRFLLSSRSVSLFLLLSAPPASPPSDTAVPPLPRADAATRCNVTFIVSFSFPLLFWLVSFIFLSLFLSFSLADRPILSAII